MSDIVKWAALAVVLVAIIAAISPLIAYIPGMGQIAATISSGLTVVSDKLRWAREMVNNFFWAPMVTAILAVSLLKPFIVKAVFLVRKLVTFIYR